MSDGPMPRRISVNTGMFRLLDVPKSRRASWRRKNASWESSGEFMRRRSWTARTSTASASTSSRGARPTLFSNDWKTAENFLQSLDGGRTCAGNEDSTPLSVASSSFATPSPA